MQNITIKANDFFELLKLKDQSMWDVFAQMIDGEEKEIVFLNDDKQYIFHYVLPATIEKLQEDKVLFAKEYAEKLSGLN
ncbi:hypothetical protein SAMN05660493_01258 [Epilithonimonas bovis DSM 19482]|uniref:Uncharacterized protein n=1 Tax=Epilithonimonas bovis DSM 19482 TaxID=1121284 RepID=A0A1U7PXM5_9FLAO|nr:hypothetical protein [Epilithonimonas bovis]SIT96571.1 hypothetical protein SAMN05660493_01258 [Epilithonimonas bovis DSM 19482]